MPISDLVPDVNVLLRLEPAEVGGVILEHLNGLPANETVLGVSLSRVTAGDALRAYPNDRHGAASRVLAEGWMWLMREVLLAEWSDDVHRLRFFITRKGRQLKTRAQVEAYRRASVFRTEALHPVIAAGPLFLRGEHDKAVFQAFRAVEVAVREAARYSPKKYGEKSTSRLPCRSASHARISSRAPSVRIEIRLVIETSTSTVVKHSKCSCWRVALWRLSTSGETRCRSIHEEVPKLLAVRRRHTAHNRPFRLEASNAEDCHAPATSWFVAVSTFVDPAQLTTRSDIKKTRYLDPSLDPSVVSSRPSLGRIRRARAA